MIHLTLIGIGTGNPYHVTGQAIRAMNAADLILIPLKGDDKADLAGSTSYILKQVEDEIRAVPNEANGYNEYAWLVANTTGDVRKAVRYSKKSLEISFDNPSYLDTLAHCQFAAGDHAAAVRTQAVAQRLEPHNRTILRNLERFRSRAEVARP